MCNGRLNALALLYIHSNIDFNPEAVLKKFIALGPHWLQFDL